MVFSLTILYISEVPAIIIFLSELLKCEHSTLYVVLDFFKNKKELVFQLKSGVSLFLTGAFLSAELKGRSAPIVKLSKACRERLQTLYERGYVPYSASVRFIVAWKGKDDAEETAVVLPEISLRKRKSTANKG